MDYEKHIEMLLENMYKMLESHEVMEGFFSRRKEKKAAKKAAKEEQRLNNSLKHEIIVTPNELKACENEFNKTVAMVKGILKREVPGCKFIENEVRHQTKNIKAGYIQHTYLIKLLDMDSDDNFKKFISKSKQPELKNANVDEPYNVVDELLQDNYTRLFDPITSKGFDDIYNDGSVLSKKKDGKEYINVLMGDEALVEVEVYMSIIVKEEE